jgi:hypothetical protein
MCNVVHMGLKHGQHVQGHNQGTADLHLHLRLACQIEGSIRLVGALGSWCAGDNARALRGTIQPHPRCLPFGAPAAWVLELVKQLQREVLGNAHHGVVLATGVKMCELCICWVGCACEQSNNSFELKCLGDVLCSSSCNP